MLSPKRCLFFKFRNCSQALKGEKGTVGKDELRATVPRESVEGPTNGKNLLSTRRYPVTGSSLS